MLRYGTPVEIARTAIQETPDNQRAADLHYDLVVGGCIRRKFPPSVLYLVVKAMAKASYPHCYLPSFKPYMTNCNSAWKKIDRAMSRDQSLTAWNAFQKRLTIDHYP